MEWMKAHKKTVIGIVVAVLAALSAIGYQWQILDQEIVDQIIEKHDNVE